MAGYLAFLPGEVIQYILEDKRLLFSDILRFGLTCKHLYKAVTENNNLWRTKFFQRWPHLREAYYEYGKSEGYLLNWKKETEASLSSRQALLAYLSCMSEKNYEKQDVSDSEFKDLGPLFHPEEGAHPLAYYFLVDELVSLINNSAPGSNLTHKYYAFKIVSYLKQNYLKKQWQKFVALPAEEQILERGATLVAQWSQPTRHICFIRSA
ncbi:hypothetical protein KM043_015223 [Ampulex compressa]|nr:hypothetical protein KM043_015223 [Ampulex compressa]